MHRMKLQFFWSKIKVKASLVLKKKKKKTFRFQDSQECHPSTSAQVWGKRVVGSGFETPRSCPDEH